MRPKCMFNDRPHPDPLPRGEGTAAVRFGGFVNAISKPAAWFIQDAAKDSPSPGGEGRGEDGRSAKTNFKTA